LNKIGNVHIGCCFRFKRFISCTAQQNLITKISEIIKLALDSKFNESRIKLLELLYVYGVSETDFLKYANEEIYKLDLKDPYEISSIIAEYDYRLANGAHPEIQLAAFLAQLGKINLKKDKSN